MSRVSISRSYAVLVGLEAYTKTRKKIKHGLHHASKSKDKVLHPEEAKKREEAVKDKSKSAEKERHILADKAKKEEESKKQCNFRERVRRKLRIGSMSSKDGLSKQEPEPVVSINGEDVESPFPRKANGEVDDGS